MVLPFNECELGADMPASANYLCPILADGRLLIKRHARCDGVNSKHTWSALIQLCYQSLESSPRFSGSVGILLIKMYACILAIQGPCGTPIEKCEVGGYFRKACVR